MSSGWLGRGPACEEYKPSREKLLCTFQLRTAESPVSHSLLSVSALGTLQSKCQYVVGPSAGGKSGWGMRGILLSPPWHLVDT